MKGKKLFSKPAFVFVILLAAIPILMAGVFIVTYNIEVNTKFIPFINYVMLMFNDDIFWIASFNVFFLPAILCIILCVVLFLVKSMILKYKGIKIRDNIFLPVTLVILTFSIFIPVYLKIYFTNKKIESTVSSTLIDWYSKKLILSNLLNDVSRFLESAWIAIFICFIIWLIERLIIKVMTSKEEKSWMKSS